MSTQTAYAAIDNHSGAIDVRTVGPTERFVKVNFIVLHTGKIIYEGTPDKWIDDYFERMAGDLNYRLSRISIAEILS